MKFFSKNNNKDDFFSVEENEITLDKISAPENPNVLTVDEVLGTNVHKS